LAVREDKPAWESIDIPRENGLAWKVLERKGDELTAADILDPAILEEAAGTLGGSTLFVAIPCREIMLVATEAYHLSDLIRNRVMNAGVHDQHPLNGWIYRIEEGAITEVIASL